VYPLTTRYIISNGGEGILTVRNTANVDLMAKIPSQLGKHTLKITLTDFYLKSSSETISVQVINDPPFLAFGHTKSWKIMMNKVSTYALKKYYDL
jgi:hypothetical protein